MVKTKRSKHNPVLSPSKEHNWEQHAAFNGSIAKEGMNHHMVYRAISMNQIFHGVRMHVSTIGYAYSGDGIHFKRRKQLIAPQEHWEQFGCEDPRITKIGEDYYIFYTAISTWPPNRDGIKIAIARTRDFNKIEERHLVTPFNAKAGVLFPRQVGGKYTMLLTAHTDMPPAKICIAQADNISDFWNENFWKDWYAKLDEHVVAIKKTERDQVEVGAVPVETEKGWILLYGFVQNYFSDDKVFRIDAALLDPENPQIVKGQTTDPLLVPEEQYEIYGDIPNVIFPSGALLDEGQFHIYYGATDTTVCRASITLTDLIAELTHMAGADAGRCHRYDVMLTRYKDNPIIAPIPENPWESKWAFNAGSLNISNKIHILYRAMGDDDTSVFGYANSLDGEKIEERFSTPVYVPREPFELKYKPGFSGCEDPRLTMLNNTIYMCYTAYDGIHPPRIALTTISADDFVREQWNWSKPILISAPGVDNKDSCIMPELFNGSYVVYHRIPPNIWIDFVTDLNFEGNTWIGGHVLLGPRPGAWDSLKVGLGGPPEKTEDGWLLIYHGVSKYDDKYRLGAALLDLNNPLKVIGRLHNPILEPEEWYENQGYRAGTVFSNGQVVKDGILYVYYGGADKYLGVASVPLKQLLDALKSGK